MDLLFKGGTAYIDGRLQSADILVSDGIIAGINDISDNNETRIIDCRGKYVFPGLTDVHVHLREPGFSYKETILSGTSAAARSGYTDVFAMPNLSPVPDCGENLKAETDIISKDAVIRVHPYGSVTIGEKGRELSKMEEMTGAIAFSDDGKGVQSAEMMLSAMKKAKALGKMICAHCEDESLLDGGYIHKGEYALAHNHRGICSESEYLPVTRDLALAKETGCKYHVCHISTKESVEAIRKAKSEGVDCSCETAPHYLLLSDSDLKEEGRFKMNPPLRSEKDKLALIAGLKDGTIDMIATDHAPHSAEEKSRGLEKSAMGITGLEAAFPVLYTGLVKNGIISLEKLIDLMSTAPAERFGIEKGIVIGKAADIAVFDLDDKYMIDSRSFVSKGKATPFDGWEVFGRCVFTLCGGRIVYSEKGIL